MSSSNSSLFPSHSALFALVLAAMAGAGGLDTPSLTDSPPAVTLPDAALAAEADTAIAASQPRPLPELAQVTYQSVQVNGIDIFYREAAPADLSDAPVILLLHGFPTSSQMFRDLLPILGTRYRVIAPDYPGFGNSGMPGREAFTYSFDNLAKTVEGFVQQLALKRFAIYVQDYGAPIGFRVASSHPDSITGLIIQNGNAYGEGLDNDFWKPIKAYWADPSDANRDRLRPFLKLDATRWQYLHGASDKSAVSPDAWLVDQAGLDRPGNAEIQLDLFLNYGTNPPLYPKWQQYFRDHQPPALIVWGRNDQIFPPAGALPYQRDLKAVDFNLLDAGHFALEEVGPIIAQKIDQFMQDRVVPALSRK